MHAPPIQTSAADQITARTPGSSSAANAIAAAGMPHRRASERQLPAQSPARRMRLSSMTTAPAAGADGRFARPLLLDRRARDGTIGAEHATITGLGFQENAAAGALI